MSNPPNSRPGRLAVVRRPRSARFRPHCEGLEDRIVLSTAIAEGAHAAPIAVVHGLATERQQLLLAHRQQLAAQRHALMQQRRLHSHTRRGGRIATGAMSPAIPSGGAATTAAVTTAATDPPAVVNTAAITPVLSLRLSPIDLNLLGVEVRLYGQDPSSPVTVNVAAQPGSGELLGNILSDVAGLLNVQGVSNALDNVLDNVISLVNQSTLSVNGQTAPPGSYTNTTPVLDAFIAPVHLNLLGAVVDTSPIHLQILAHSGTGLALGNIVTDLANILNNPTGNVVKDVESGLTNLLNQLDAMFPTIAGAATPAGSASTAGSLRILSLTVPPIDLNLLGLILQTSTIQVNATAQPGSGQLLGNLLVDLFASLHASQSDLDTINADLNGVLAKVVGVLNASALTLPSGALGSLSPILQELASPTLVNTSGGTVAPEPVLNLNIATNDGSPPVDVNLLGVVVTTSNVQVQLFAQPGTGLLLGNLVYNTSHLLDGGLLSVLGILGGLGI